MYNAPTVLPSYQPSCIAAYLSSVTTHFYPTCSDSANATIPWLLSEGRPVLQTGTRRWVVAAAAAGLPLRISEMNSFCKQGKEGVSDRLAAALWLLDMSMRLVMSGVKGAWGMPGHQEGHGICIIIAYESL